MDEVFGTHRGTAAVDSSAGSAYRSVQSVSCDINVASIGEGCGCGDHLGGDGLKAIKRYRVLVLGQVEGAEALAVGGLVGRLGGAGMAERRGGFVRAVVPGAG